MNSYTEDFEKARIISRVLTLYYIEGKNQAEVAKLLKLSTAKVNRLIKRARDQGMVEITIRTPFQHLFDIAQQLQRVSGIPEAVVVPKLGEHPEAVLQTIGRAGADYLLDHLREGDTITVSGGKAMDALVQSVQTTHKYDVKVVPSTGGVQGAHDTDVNYLAAQLADKLGGTAFQLHAPLFVDSKKERDALLAMRQTSEILDIARKAQIAIHGVGSVQSKMSSYFQMRSGTVDTASIMEVIKKEGGKGDLLAQLYNADGKPCAKQYNEKVVGLSPKDLTAIPLNIGVAAMDEKVESIYSALRGNLLQTLVTDEPTALRILDLYKENAKPSS